MEDDMTALKSLTFTALPKSGANPVLNRRTTILARLEEQKLLLNDPSYIRVSQRWRKKEASELPSRDGNGCVEDGSDRIDDARQPGTSRFAPPRVDEPLVSYWINR
jgi:hypothetical protein